jgi:6-phosphogluconolactonase
MNLLVGTYSMRGSEGIYRLTLDDQTGDLALAGVVANLKNPSFLAFHPREPWLYTVCEEASAGAISALARQPGGTATVINHQSTCGLGPCHVTVDPQGEWVAAANYRSGEVVVLPIGEQGALQPAADCVRQSGQGPVTERQEGPHAHSVNFDATGQFLIAADLGVDRLMVFAVDREQGRLTPCPAEGVAVTPGAGPRHFTFHPHGPWAYLINELDNTIIAYHWDAAAGQLHPLQTLPTLPEDYTGVSYCADIQIHPSGRFLYGSNRGHDSLALFALDPASGLLEPRGHFSTGGEHPRSFALSPQGDWLVVGNMYSDTLTVFRVAEDGALSPAGNPLSLPSPACLLFEP